MYERTRILCHGLIDSPCRAWCKQVSIGLLCLLAVMLSWTGIFFLLLATTSDSFLAAMIATMMFLPGVAICVILVIALVALAEQCVLFARYTRETAASTYDQVRRSMQDYAPAPVPPV